VHCGAGKSFPSSHASNNFFAATALSSYFPRGKYFFYTIATLIALSRVFVGVHYPIDITTGAILGTMIGIFISKIFLRLKS
jgi:undecaprenyl-diphosphatase